MEVEFDPAKNAANRAKHGVPLALGMRIPEGPILIEEDTRRDYGETRFNAFGMVNDRLMVCTFTMRGPIGRIISVHKASRQEPRQCLS